MLIWAFILHTGSQSRKSDSHPKLLDPACFQGITHWFCSCPLTHPQRVRMEEVVYETLVSPTSTGWQRPLVHNDGEGSWKPIAVAERAPAWGREDKFIHPQSWPASALGRMVKWQDHKAQAISRCHIHSICLYPMCVLAHGSSCWQLQLRIWRAPWRLSQRVWSLRLNCFWNSLESRPTRENWNYCLSRIWDIILSDRAYIKEFNHHREFY